MLLMFVDLDGMKWINDSFGHAEGDIALLETAQVLKDTFRESDIIGRLGGDEFAVLATLTNDSNASSINARLDQQLDKLNRHGSHRYKLTLSTGSVDYGPDETASIKEMLERADKSMYVHKISKERSKGYYNAFWKG
jgi:diguanylate cyclase (GGDEF)-like protein